MWGNRCGRRSHRRGRRKTDRVTSAGVGHIFRGRYTGGRVDFFAIAETIDASPVRGEMQRRREVPALKRIFVDGAISER
jgi:hypothetical protein